jgi:solute:Na+ symporter, SSS family
LAYGGLLGVFLLGVLTKRATQAGTIFGMLCGLAFNIYLWSSLRTQVAWTWYVTFGATITFVAGYVASLLIQTRTETTEAHARN